MTSVKAKTFIYLSISMYLAGLIGLNIEYSKEFFRFLTPFHLLSSAAILLYFEPKKSKSLWFYVVITYFIGFLVEVAGVNTGLIFGEYVYGKTLGPKIWGTPYMIGLNWFVLSFVTAKSLSIWSHKASILKKEWIFILTGALTMTFLDFIAEPPAIYHDMWSWRSSLPPFQNYAAWFVVSAMLMYIFKKLKIEKFNPLALPILVLQFFFFLLQYLTL